MWTYETTGNGAFVTITSPDGRTAFLQGDDAARFMARTNHGPGGMSTYDEILCAEYDEICLRENGIFAPAS